MPGTIKDLLQSVVTHTPAMSDPKMLPTDVCEFQTPNTSPRLINKTSITLYFQKKHKQGSEYFHLSHFKSYYLQSLNTLFSQSIEINSKTVWFQNPFQCLN